VALTSEFFERIFIFFNFISINRGDNLHPNALTIQYNRSIMQSMKYTHPFLLLPLVFTLSLWSATPVPYSGKIDIQGVNYFGEAVQEEVKDDTRVPLLIPCEACGGDAAKKAEKCLKCGHPTPDSVVAYKEAQELARIMAEREREEERKLADIRAEEERERQELITKRVKICGSCG
jgi:hypothetical protein